MNRLFDSEKLCYNKSMVEESMPGSVENQQGREHQPLHEHVRDTFTGAQTVVKKGELAGFTDNGEQVHTALRQLHEIDNLFLTTGQTEVFHLESVNDISRAWSKISAIEQFLQSIPTYIDRASSSFRRDKEQSLLAKVNSEIAAAQVRLDRIFQALEQARTRLKAEDRQKMTESLNSKKGFDVMALLARVSPARALSLMIVAPGIPGGTVALDSFLNQNTHELSASVDQVDEMTVNAEGRNESISIEDTLASLEKSLEITDVNVETVEAQVQPTPEFPVGSQYAISNPQEGYNSINIRADQSVNSAIVTTIPRGERLVVNRPAIDLDPNDGWYEAYDESGERLGYVHNSVFRFEGDEIPPTPTLPIGPTPIQEAPTPSTDTTTTTPEDDQSGDLETDSDQSGDFEPTGIPEVINPTHTPVLAPTASESVINATRNPDYARNIGLEVRQIEARILEEMNLQPLPSEQVSWMTFDGEQLPVGIVEGFDILENADEIPNYFAFSGVLRGVREFQTGGQNWIMAVVDVNNNRIVLTDSLSIQGEAWGLRLIPRGGDLNQAQYQQVDRAGYFNQLRNIGINQQIVLVAYPSWNVHDEVTEALAAQELNQLTQVEVALQNDTPITNPEIGLQFNTIQGLVLQSSS